MLVQAPLPADMRDFPEGLGMGSGASKKAVTVVEAAPLTSLLCTRVPQYIPECHNATTTHEPLR